ncbi:MAG: nucleoside-triphosphatase [Candidatus Thorarchaeota archaeon]
MNPKILITGLPRSGKSTLIATLMNYFILEKNLAIHGFLTPEVKSHGQRIGFDIQDISSKEKVQFARVGTHKTLYKLGKYKVFLEGLENTIQNIQDTPLYEIDLVIIDEIGKMELFSEKFTDFIKQIFNTNLSIIATIGLKLKHSIKDHLLNLPNVKLFVLERMNFQKIYQDIISMIE